MRHKILRKSVAVHINDNCIFSTSNESSAYDGADFPENIAYQVDDRPLDDSVKLSRDHWEYDGIISCYVSERGAALKFCNKGLIFLFDRIPETIYYKPL